MRSRNEDHRRTVELGREHLSGFPRDFRVVGVTILSLNVGGGLRRKAEALEFLSSLRHALEGDGYFERPLSFQMTENNLWDEGRRHAQIGLMADPGSFFSGPRSLSASAAVERNLKSSPTPSLALACVRAVTSGPANSLMSD